MVRVKLDRLDQELSARGWTPLMLRAHMSVAENTMRSMLAGNSISDNTQRALFTALDGRVPKDELFEIVVEEVAYP